MEQTATFSKSNSPEEHAVLIASLQLIGPLTPTARTYGSTANVQANPTPASQFIAIQGTINFAEDISGSGVILSIIPQGDITSSGEATETHVRYGYDHPRLLFGNLGYTEVHLWHQLVALPESPWISTEVIQEEERETIRADTDRALSFYELLSALDKISRPMEVEDVPLSVDPDDYPVV